MKFIVCSKPGQLLMKDKEEPIPKANEALLAVKKIGICGTDLHAFAGNQAFFSYPRILGHELAAEVLEIGYNEQGIVKGDKVIVMPYISCGECIACRKGKTNCCVRLKVLGVHSDGGMQEKISIRTDLLIRCNNLSYNEIAIVEPLAIGAHAIRRAGAIRDEYVVVVGCGPIGIGIMKQAQLAGAKVIALDTNEVRLDFVSKTLRIDHIINAGENPVQQISDLTNGDMATVVFDASGNKTALENGLDYMAHGGRYVLVGLSNGLLTFMHPTLHARESTILCSRNATPEDFRQVLKMLPQFPTDDYITHEVPFSALINNFESFTKPENNVIKAVINI